MKRLKNYLLYHFRKHISPEIIGGYKNSDGSFRSKTRISNMAHLSSKQNIELEDNVFIGHFNYIDGFRKVKIGTGVQITNYVSILTHSSHNTIRELGDEYNERLHESKELESGEISIGNYTFIGPHSTIMPGTKIGDNCIVSAHSFVSGHFPNNSIIRGIPAKIVGSTG